MRKILYRGKSIKTKEWVESNSVCFPNSEGVLSENPMLKKDGEWVEVEEESIGQYTGVKESFNLIEEPEKKKIFEGDIVQLGDWESIYLIIFDDGKFIAKRIRGCSGNFFTDLYDALWPSVIGNKNDNPELLERL